jgi:hypothetical protein
MIFCARATRGLRRPSLDARSGRSISLHPLRDNERAWKDHLYRFDARNRGSTRPPPEREMHCWAGEKAAFLSILRGKTEGVQAEGR